MAKHHVTLHRIAKNPSRNKAEHVIDILINTLLAFQSGMVVLGAGELSKKIPQFYDAFDTHSVLGIVAKLVILVMGIASIALIPTTIWRYTPEFYTIVGISVFSLVLLTIIVLTLRLWSHEDNTSADNG